LDRAALLFIALFLNPIALGSISSSSCFSNLFFFLLAGVIFILILHSSSSSSSSSSSPYQDPGSFRVGSCRRRSLAPIEADGTGRRRAGDVQREIRNKVRLYMNGKSGAGYHLWFIY
ncbi:unnamed protein product, partial [Musa acuminata subsp. burmannicoides]